MSSETRIPDEFVSADSKSGQGHRVREEQKYSWCMTQATIQGTEVKVSMSQSTCIGSRNLPLERSLGH